MLILSSARRTTESIIKPLQCTTYYQWKCPFCLSWLQDLKDFYIINVYLPKKMFDLTYLLLIFYDNKIFIILSEQLCKWILTDGKRVNMTLTSVLTSWCCYLILHGQTKNMIIISVNVCWWNEISEIINYYIKSINKDKKLLLQKHPTYHGHLMT